MVEESNILKKLEIEFIDMENIYKEVFDGKDVKEYTNDELLDFIDDVMQLFNSVIRVVTTNWQNMEIVKKMLSAANLLETLEERTNLPEDDDDDDDGGMFM